MTSRFKRRLARIEKRQRPAPEPPPDPRGFVLATLVGFHCCDRRADEHHLEAYVAAAKGAHGETAMQRRFDELFAAHGIEIENEPKPHAVEAMQRLLDGVPERWRMPRGLGGPPARVRCGLRDEIRPSRGRAVLNNACRHAPPCAPQSCAACASCSDRTERALRGCGLFPRFVRIFPAYHSVLVFSSTPSNFAAARWLMLPLTKARAASCRLAIVRQNASGVVSPRLMP
jgi:hypothetical protein